MRGTGILLTLQFILISGSPDGQHQHPVQDTGYAAPDTGYAAPSTGYGSPGTGSGYAAPSGYESTGYDSTSYNEVDTGYSYGQKQTAPLLPEWVMPALLTVCALGLIPVWRMVPVIPPPGMWRRKRDIHTSEETSNRLNSAVDFIQLFSHIYQEEECLLKLGCEMVKLQENATDYPTIAFAFRPVMTGRFASYLSDDRCSKLTCSLYNQQL